MKRNECHEEFIRVMQDWEQSKERRRECPRRERRKGGNAHQSMRWVDWIGLDEWGNAGQCCLTMSDRKDKKAIETG